MSRTLLDIDLTYDRFIGEGGELELLRQILIAHAPRWSAKTWFVIAPGVRQEFDLSSPGSLPREAVKQVQVRGPTYHALVARFGAGLERVFGGCEIRGASAELIVVLSMDAFRCGESAASCRSATTSVCKSAERASKVWRRIAGRQRYSMSCVRQPIHVGGRHKSSPSTTTRQ